MSDAFEKAEVMDGQRQSQLMQILIELAADSNDIQDKTARDSFYRRFEAIYCDSQKQVKYRHMYSHIFFVITQIDAEKHNADVLAQNLIYLYQEYPDKQCSSEHDELDAQHDVVNIKRELGKLADHVNLDVGRLNYLKVVSQGISEKMLSKEELGKVQSVASTAEKQLDALQTRTEQLDVKLEETKTKVENVQRDSVSILGIFAAIVLAFTGGLAFSTSVLQNMADVSIYRLIGVALIISFTLLNTIYLLLKYLSGITSMKEPKSHIILVNVALAVAGVAVILVWKFR